MADRTDAVVTLDSRFFDKTAVDESTPVVNGCHCRIWTGRVETNGRGRFWYAGKPVIAYRLACAYAEGKSLEELAGLVARHKCDNPLCVEPAHQESGTQSENMKECFARGRSGGFVAKYIR